MELFPSTMLRIGMTNPPYILEHLRDIGEIMRHDQVYAFLHVPVQAGSSLVLEAMKRQYTIQDFHKVCDVLLEMVPGITIATDVICGFPTETDQDFQETLKVLEKYKFPILHISQFYPRPGTPAAKMQRIDTKIVKDRSRLCTALFHSYGGDENMVGQVLSVLVTELSPDENHFVGHDKYYRQVLVPNEPSLMGKRIEVEITNVTKWSMIGKCTSPIDNTSINSLPKLVRSGKQIVIVDSKSQNGARSDGAIYSSGKQQERKQDGGSGSWAMKKYLLAGLVMVPLMFMPIRKSIKVTALVVGTLLLQNQ